MFYRIRNPDVIEGMTLRRLRYWYDMHKAWQESEKNYVEKLEAESKNA